MSVCSLIQAGVDSFKMSTFECTGYNEYTAKIVVRVVLINEKKYGKLQIIARSENAGGKGGKDKNKRG